MSGPRRADLTRCRRLAWAAGMLLLCGTAAAEEQVPATKYRLIPQWIPQAQFAGYYVALDRGFYSQRGLDVEILAGGPRRPASECLARGEAEFATMWLATAIQRRAEGLKVVNLAQIVQRSALMLVAKRASGIRSPSEMNGKKISLWGEEFQFQPRAFFKKYGLSVKVVPQSSTISVFLRGGVDVASAMWYNEYHLMLNAGLNPDELNTFFFHDHDLNFPEDGIYCLESTWRADPAACRDFARASLDGWRWAFENSEEAIEIVSRRMRAEHLPVNRVHQKWMLARMRDIIQPVGGVPGMGELREGDYRSVAETLRDNEVVSIIPDFSEFHPREDPLAEK